jgi:hypothetical protein
MDFVRNFVITTFKVDFIINLPFSIKNTLFKAPVNEYKQVTDPQGLDL